MTLGLAVLALGFTVAALAGIPALVENRTVGDVVVIVGFAVGVVGGVLMLTALPASRRNRADLHRAREADIDDLMVKRRRIVAQQQSHRTQIQRIESAILMRTTLRASGDVSDEMANRRTLEIELINLDADLAMNANDLKRLGISVSE